ncbi:ciliary microtubule inner protein 5 [Acanthopagrus schlegelii]
MDLSGVRRASSAGYRLPERNNGTRPMTTQPPAAERTRRAQGEAPSQELQQDKIDPVKKDHLWKELVWTEKRGVREWEKNWGFLQHYDQMGQLKPQEPLPSYVTLFSDRTPNTTNQMLGSRLSTPLGSELVKLDRLGLLSGSHHKRKLDPEMLPC